MRNCVKRKKIWQKVIQICCCCCMPILVLIGLYFLKCTKFDQLILRKTIKIVTTRRQLLMLKCTKIDFGWGSSPDPAGGAYSAPVDGRRQHLRSARRGQLEMHRFRLSSLGGRSFFCAAPSLWNTLPVTVTDSSLSLHSFLGHLKTFFFSLYPPAHRAR